MERMNIGQLQVRSRFSFLTIKNCYIKEKFGEHGKARITGEIKGRESRDALTDVRRDKVEIVMVFHEEGGRVGERILFSGMIRQVELKEEGKYTMLTLDAVSHSWKMDIHKRSRSFQNITRTYREIGEEILQDYKGRLLGEIEDRKLEYPLIQHRETDFQFLKRILSYVGEGIKINSLSRGVFLSSVKDRGVHQGEINVNSHVHQEIPFYSREGEWIATGYVLKDMDYASVGDSLFIQGKEYLIKEVDIGFIGSLLSCTWKVFPKVCFKEEKIHSSTLKNAVFVGRVLKTEQEKVRIHLQIDEEQKEEEAYEFPWIPITGNLLYCMPEVGTQVALAFEGGKEERPMVIYNVRENGEICGEMGDYENRYFTTKGQKRMYLKPGEMGLINLDGGNGELSLKDGDSIGMRTNNNLSILAKGQVEIKGRKVYLTTPQEVTLVKKDILSPTVINMCNAFDAIGKTGNFKPTEQSIEKKRKRERPMGGQQEKYSLEGVVEHIFASIPMETGEDPILKVIAGAMPLITRLNKNVENKEYKKRL